MDLKFHNLFPLDDVDYPHIFRSDLSNPCYYMDDKYFVITITQCYHCKDRKVILYHGYIAKSLELIEPYFETNHVMQDLYLTIYSYELTTQEHFNYLFDLMEITH
jgi:hypothetical protein